MMMRVGAAAAAAVAQYYTVSKYGLAVYTAIDFTIC